MLTSESVCPVNEVPPVFFLSVMHAYQMPIYLQINAP